MGRTKTKREPEEADAGLDGLGELVGMLKARKPSRLLFFRLMLSYVVLGEHGTFGERMEKYTVAVAVVRADARLRRRHGVKLRVTDPATLRLVALCYPTDGPVRSPGEVMRREIEEPAERLVRSGKVKRGGVIGVDRHPLGVRLRVGALRPTP